MGQHAGMTKYLKKYQDDNAENNEVYLARTIIGLVAYMILVAPVLSLMVVGALDLSGDYIMPIAIMCVMAGIYVTEKYYCRNLHH